MTSNQLTAIAKNRPFLTTEEFAQQLKLRPQSIRKRFSQTGSYWGLRPLKLPSGRLMWAADSLEQLAGESAL